MRASPTGPLLARHIPLSVEVELDYGERVLAVSDSHGEVVVWAGTIGRESEPCALGTWTGRDLALTEGGLARWEVAAIEDALRLAGVDGARRAA